MPEVYTCRTRVSTASGRGRPSWPAPDTGGQIEDGDDLARVTVDVEISVTDEPVRHHIDGGSDRHRHDTWVEVTSKFSIGLEARELLFEEVSRDVDVPAIDAASAVGREGAVPEDLDDGDHVVPVLAHKREVRLDVGAKHGRSG